MRVDPSDLPRHDWVHFLRARDLTQLLESAPTPLKGPVLEIGCGDGFLTTRLRASFDKVIPIEPRPRASVPGLVIGDGQALPFKDNTFGFVFSSNVLEHIMDVPSALAEFQRVTKPDAVMVHTMPTPWWKLLQFAEFPIDRGRLIMRKFGRRDPKSPKPNNSELNHSEANGAKQGSLRSMLWPEVHGVSRGHMQESHRFSSAVWRRTFRANGYQVVREDPLFVHSPYRLRPFQYLQTRERIAKAGFPSVRAYWIEKAG